MHLDVHFVDAVQIGEFVEAKCQGRAAPRSLIFMSAELVVGDARGRDRERRVEDAGQGLTQVLSWPEPPPRCRSSWP